MCDRAVAHARVPVSVAASSFQVALVAVPPADPAQPAPAEEEEDLKLVVVTRSRHMFRYNVPKNISELSALQLSGEETATVQCVLDDEALLEY